MAKIYDNKKNILLVFGTRPEAIKMAPVALELKRQDCFRVEICLTGQHREMLDQVMDIFDLTADYDLEIMKPGQDLFDVTAKVLLGLRDVLDKAAPDVVLVHGDTTTCLAAGLAAFYKGIKVAHVEAGLRTGNLSAPFPEEANRSLVAKIASYNFAPTETSRKNLLDENINDELIWVTGNTVIDALLITKDSALKKDDSVWKKGMGEGLYGQIVDRERKKILITGHRRENFGEGFIDLCSAIREIAERHPSWVLVYPVHLNPNVQKPVYDILSGLENVHLIKPVEYLSFVWLMSHADLVLTDSGGVQEEGPSLGKPILVMREVTERPEAVSAGTVKLVGTNPEKIVKGVERVLENSKVYKKMSEAINPYGDGFASKRIAKVLIDSLSEERGS